MPPRLIESLATTEPLAELFSDQSVLQSMLDFEAALARVQARLGIIPQSAADAISSAAKADRFDIAALAHATLRAGTPGIPLVKELTAQVRNQDPEAAHFVHWGATSQDAADTALILLLNRARPLLRQDSSRLVEVLIHLSEQEKNTILLGRTLMQAAPPVTFGLKAAGWAAAIARGVRQLDTAFAEALVLQFGGASGTLASLGDKGIDVSRELAAELKLASPDAPWHTQRDRLATLVCACGVLTASLGKMARDITLLMQCEVDEATEPGGDGRGGSSTMPQKRNPIACALTLAASDRTPGLVASFLTSMVQEHERGVGGWQAEWPIVASVIQSTGLAISSMAEVAQGLSLNPEKMKSNLESTRGTVFAERAMMLLGKTLGRDVAHQLLEKATRKAVEDGKHLAEVLADMPEVASQIDRSVLRDLEVPAHYLGSAETFRQQLLAAARRKPPGSRKES